MMFKLLSKTLTLRSTVCVLLIVLSQSNIFGQARTIVFDPVNTPVGEPNNSGPLTTWDTTTTNWREFDVQTTFMTNDHVIFGTPDGGGALSEMVTVTVSGQKNVSSMTMGAAPNGLFYRFTGSAINSTGALTVNNPGGAVFNNGVNFFGSVNFISGNVYGTGLLNVYGAISAQHGTLGISLTGPAALTKTTSGTVTLSVTNNYTGGTNVNAGFLQLGASNVLLDSGAINVNGGTFTVQNFSDTVGAVTLNSGAITGTTGVLTGSSYTVSSGSITAILGGTGALTKQNSGTVTLSGANTYTGGTNVNAGTLMLGASNVLANTGAVTVNGGTLDIGTHSDVVGVLTLTGGSINGSGTLTGSSYDFRSGTLNAKIGTGAFNKSTTGTVTINSSNTSLGAVTLTDGTLAGSGSIAGSSYTVQNGTISLTMGGSGALTKTTTGTVTLNAAQNYTGGTTVSAGTLALSASNLLADSGAVNVSGGILDIGANSDTVGALTLAGGTINGSGTLTGSSYNFQSGTLNAKIGTGALNKSTTGTVTINSTNTSVGAVTLTDGTLAGSGSITGSSYNVQNGAVSLTLAGSAALTKTTSGTVTLGGTQTYTGGTTVSAGTLALSASNVLNDSGAVNVNGGILDIGANSDTVGALILAGGTINGSGTLTGSSYNFQSGTLNAKLGSGALNKSTAGTVTINSSNASLGAVNLLGGTLAGSGSITGTSYDVQNGAVSVTFAGSAALNKTSGGTVTLSGTQTYTGGTNINAGTLALGGSNVLADSGAVNVNNGANFDIGSNTDTVGAVTLTNGSITGSGTLIGSSFNVQSGTISANLGGAGSAMTKTGTGTVTLSGSNSYSGGTTISAGTLLANGTGSLGSATVTVGSAGTLGGNGTSSADVVVNGTLAPGTSVGTLGVGTTTFNSSSNFNWEVNLSALTADLLNVQGNLNIGNNANLNLSSLATTIIPSSTKFTLISYSGTWNGGSFAGFDDESTFVFASNVWKIDYNDTSAGLNGGTGSSFLTITAIPEPSSALLLGLGLASCMLRRRKR